MGGGSVFTPSRSEVAQRDPRRGPVAGRAQLLEAAIGGLEPLVGLVEPVLLEKRATEDELRVSELVQVIVPFVQKPQGVPRLLLGQSGIPRAKVHLRERGDGL